MSFKKDKTNNNSKRKKDIGEETSSFEFQDNKYPKNHKPKSKKNFPSLNFNQEKTFNNKRVGRNKSFTNEEENLNPRKSFGNRDSFGENGFSTGKKPFKGKRFFDDNNSFGERKTFGRKKSFTNEEENFNPRKSFGNRDSFGENGFSTGKKSFKSKRFFDDNNSFGERKTFGRKKSFTNEEENLNPRKSFGNRDSFGENGFSTGKKPFKSKRFFDDNNSFGERKFFNHEEENYKPKKSFSNKSFTRKGFSNNEDSFGKKKFNKLNQFNDRKTSSSNKKRDSSNESFNKGKFHINKENSTNKNFDNKISLEYVLNYFHQHEVVDMLQLQDNMSADNADMFFYKVNLLIKRGILKAVEESKFTLNSQYINEDISEYSYIKIKSQLIGNHYIVNISPLNKRIQSEEEIIIENLKENLKNRIILAKISLQEEKIIATPVFYLNEIHPIKTLDETNLIKGVYQIYDNVDLLIPINYKSRKNITLLNTPKNLSVGAVIEAKLIESNGEYPESTFIRVLSQDNSATTASSLSVYQYDLRHEFSEDILDLAKNFGAPSLDNRRDIRNIPLVTIDDEDAKDFDDAIYAQKINDKEDTYKIYVAIADVSWYVKSSDTIDIEAQLRGNSVYLPGLTIPMLPKELSNGWCSLNPNEDRGCLVMEGIINRNGELESFEFYRGLMKSHARLTYTQVANAIDGEVSKDLAPLMQNVITPLKEVFHLLEGARKRRNAVEINSQEVKFILDKKNNILDVKVKENLISHKIVEEFMITANVATAKLIAKAGLSLSGQAIYRIHAKPTTEKILVFTNTLKSFGLNITPPVNVTSTFFNNLLKEFSHKSFFNALNEAVLRCQSQAEYANENIGHFGLALKEYCHFTSPIRRYSDLMIHRLVLSIINNEEFHYSSATVANIAQSISMSERLAFNAEKSAKNRAFAKWLSSKIGESFMSEISSITNAGIFVNLIDNGASGLIPMRTISRGFANVDLAKSIIKDKQAGRTFSLGDKLPIIIKEADEVRGLLTFIIDEDKMPKRIKNRSR